MPRAWQWSGIKQAADKTLVSMINMEEEFTFRLHIHTSSGVVSLALYGSTIGTLPSPDAMILRHWLWSWLRPYKLKFGESTVLYNPQMVLIYMG